MSEPGRASDRLRRMASDYEEATSAARSEQIVARAMARARAGRHTRRPILEAMLGTSMLLALAIGLGVATAGTLPGDPLYGVSRAYEEVGTFVGVVDPLEQRLNEVIALVDRGDRTRAALAASEALVELERKTGVSVRATPTPVASTTTTTDAPDEPGGTTPPTTAPAVTVEADPEPEAEDPVQTMRIAAETLLRSVEDDGSEVEEAASQLAAAASSITAAITAEGETPEAGDTSTTVPGDSSSSSTTTPKSTTSTSSTTTSTTTTTVPGSTTTTAPDDQGEGTSGGDDGGPGPIFLPPDF